ncbi:MAG: pyridoxamine kinase [Lachnospiraceae bacterium]|jgi:pyridoxine kinase|nr:pyridoxamine kinase [Lachnospiraceae bacterium]
MEKQKRVAAIHDISCFGRCSLTVALPIISAAGIETSVIPTAVLSTHTGGFTGFTYRDLTDDILPVANHWKSLGLSFDAIYTGFLGSFEQIDIVVKTFETLKDDGTLIAVDPVMADYGKLYSIFPETFPDGMRRVCEAADVIMPNMTEAALLLHEPYHDGPHTEEEIKHILKALADIGPKKIVLTGASYDKDTVGAASYDTETGEFGYTKRDIILPMCHGTGDVFGSVLVAALLKGATLAQAAASAVDFTVECIKRTRAANIDERFGVIFEEGLSGLNELIEKNKK